MQLRISPAIKGLITALLMIASILIIYYFGKTIDPRLQYLVYVFYSLGIAWTLVVYRKSADFTGKFGDIFGQGFRCFIAVTLLMALFYGLFNYLHPEFADEMAQAYKEHLQKENGKTPDEITSTIATFKKQYTLKLVSGAIFGYLIIGAGITAVLGGLFAKRK